MEEEKITPSHPIFKPAILPDFQIGDGTTALLAAFGSGYAVAAYILFCAIVSISATALLPDYTNRDISGEDA